MEIDTGQFTAITDQVAALAAAVDRLEQRERQRDVVDRLITGGVPDAAPRPRWLYPVRPG